MASAKFTSIGPDWYNIFKQEDGSLRLEETPVIATYDEEVASSHGLYIHNYYRAGYVSFNENGNWAFASKKEGYLGTFHLPKIDLLSSEDIHAIADTNGPTWIVPPLSRRTT